MALNGSIDIAIPVSGKVGDSQLLGGLGNSDTLLGGTETQLVLNGAFGYGFDDPWSFYRGYWNDNKYWMDSGSWEDEL